MTPVYYRCSGPPLLASETVYWTLSVHRGWTGTRNKRKVVSVSSQSRVQQLLQAAKAVSKLSVRDIAEKAGVSHGTVSNYINGADRKHPIPEDMLDKLAKGFGIPAPRLRAAHYADRGLIPAESAEPTKAGEDVISAVLADPDLLPEAKEHLVNQYGLLLRIQAAARTTIPAERLAREQEQTSAELRDQIDEDIAASQENHGNNRS
jgi:transcriptional regulator with XRE-family HTH domain